MKYVVTRVRMLSFLKEMGQKFVLLSLLISTPLFGSERDSESQSELASELASDPASTKTEIPKIEAPKLDQSAAPDELINEATQALIKSLMVGSELPIEQQQAYYLQAVEVIIAPYIDFKVIARRVMAKHYRLATKDQREAFNVAFRESLIDTYTKGFTGYSDEVIQLLPFRGTRTSKKSGVVRASVEMEIRTKEGSVLPVVYQVYKNKQGHWRLENMILSGVNLGLTFRNQFNEALRASKGDIDSVIQDWNVTTPDSLEDTVKEIAKDKSKAKV